MTSRLMLAFCVLAGTTTVASAQAPSPTGPPGLDHFECYYITPRPIPPVDLRTWPRVVQALMQLKDQFDDARDQVTQVVDIRIGRFCNPVEKIVRGRRSSTISNPAARLTLFQLEPQPIVPRQVWISNQFGNQQLALSDAFALAVPTGAAAIVPGTEPVSSLPIPKGLDHFKCYNASGRRIGLGVGLHDEIRSESTRVLAPIAFCNPVEKTRPPSTSNEPDVTPIMNAKAHLACYTIVPLPLPYGLTYLITNQVGSGHIHIEGADVLCVPSWKVRWYDLSTPRPRGGRGGGE